MRRFSVCLKYLIRDSNEIKMEYRNSHYTYLTVFLLCTLGLYNSCAVGNSCHCPLHWEEFGNYCYIFIDRKIDYYKATQVCQRLSYGTRTARITSILSAEESQFIDDYMIKLDKLTPIWIDLMYNGTEYTWSDGSPFDYANWKSGYPETNPTDQCIQRVWSTKKWSAYDCSLTRRFLCKMQKRPWVLN